jgi:hypothetical protein
MSIKINLDVTEARAYVDFMLWIARHPQGGTFQYGEIKIIVTKHDQIHPQELRALPPSTQQGV